LDKRSTFPEKAKEKNRENLPVPLVQQIHPDRIRPQTLSSTQPISSLQVGRILGKNHKDWCNCSPGKSHNPGLVVLAVHIVSHFSHPDPVYAEM